MNKNIFLIISSLLLFLASCQQPKDNFTINAKFNGFSENSKVIISNASTGKILDSTKLLGNQFISTGFIAEPPILINIVINSENNESVYTFIYIGNETVEISGHKNDFPDALKISGSKFQEFKTKLDKEINPLNKKRNERLQKMFALRQEGKWNDSLQKVYWSKENGIITKIDNQTSQITKKFIEENINSNYALSQLVTYKMDFSKDFIELQIGKLNSDFENSEYAKVLRTYLKNEPLNKGDRFYDFSGENQNGKKVKFSSYFKDKYVLLEFYSPYCSWCIKALLEIKKLTKQEGENLEIVTVNVDKDKEDWLKNYKKNNVTWTSIYVENGRYSDAYTKYRVFATPTYYFFDKNGNLLEKWDGYSENLIEQISEGIKNGG